MKNLLFKFSGWMAFLWAAIIFVLCATPGQYIPSANWLDLLSFDKFVHASMFFILTVLWLVNALKQQSATWMHKLIVFVGICYGGLLEIMQAKCFSNRSADWKDFVANSFGCVVAFLLLGRIQKIMSPKTNT
jgi:surface polysaccharide O-acyltransferase-like enzyme